MKELGMECKQRLTYIIPEQKAEDLHTKNKLIRE